MEADPDQLGGAAAVIVAAGRGERMGGAAGGVRKAFLQLAGATLLEHTCAAFDAAPSIAALVVVTHQDDVATVEGWRAARPAFAKVTAVVAGGAERADSVVAGVAAVPSGTRWIAVHDAARALIRPEAIERVLAAARDEGGALLALPVQDTLKASDDGAHAARTVDRAGLFAAQTPQAFETDRFRDSLAAAAEAGLTHTDCAAAWERAVGPPVLVPGDPTNLKITTPADLALARAILAARDEELAS
jgi:2-C-methyl-D-erythritol 4-phosphate cytidylyltransferase